MNNKRFLIFSPITKKWEIGRIEKNSVTRVDELVRDDGSWICHKGDEVATYPLPLLCRQRTKRRISQ